MEQGKFWKFHDKNYKKLLIVPALILIFSFAFMGYFYSVHHDFISKDISLTGGTSITLNDPNINANQLQKDMSGKLQDVNTRSIYDLITQKQVAVVLETKTDAQTTKTTLQDYLGYSLTDQNSSIQFTGSNISQSFYEQLLIAVLFAFFFMSIVVIIIYRSFIPAFAVILSAFADIFMALTVVNVFNIQVSSAGIIAFLMLIGYSVDTDILLTNKVLRSKEKTREAVNKNITRAFKTGITMTLTAIAAVAFCLIIIGSFSNILSQIFTILIIGLFFDIINTWITNVCIVKWYTESKEKK
ncbi:MAG TPA: protein translocase subunit SecF [Patescibacteria group bacterium]|nr:protein translocase subunit SecF [Patescibacteria group bacterium]